ncbi:class I SAM-dependent methyltransferase [Nocardia sp. NPDC004654]|uniref:class I SAM-dependent methyltransferase n=1 Tax=Nocardia sp. NPDC004654 TaxID=3154776 RepID=UPI0033BE2492
MLTIDFDRLGVGSATRVIDVGCGAGRHAFEAYRRGADIVAFDQDADEIDAVATMFAAMAQVGEAPATAVAEAVRGDALALPYPDGTFDCVIASEILEHIPADDAAIAELVRVLRPGGTLVVTVPRWLPERICWWLSDEYHANEGGHVRIYRADELRDKVTARGLNLVHRHHAHALHAPYWWLKCLLGVDKDDHAAVRLYHRFLVWDMMRRPALTRVTEAAMNPLVGKSVALYFHKPAVRYAQI